ncbi:MAG: hypothetical protein JWO05_3832 [Gemmatimonadetes bacterium]|nr:hypothetical protein [Gemmatimonadota bacterium]
MTLPDEPRQLANVRRLARLLDTAVEIPGTGIRFGLDPILGLVPGIGDLAGTMLSGYIVLVATQLGASRAIVLRMIANIAIDTFVGAVPVLGDAFDVAWKSNARNVALLERYVERPVETRRASGALFLFAVAAMTVLAAAGIFFTIVAVKALVGVLR